MKANLIAQKGKYSTRIMHGCYGTKTDKHLSYY